MSAWLPADVKRLDEREALRGELRALTPDELEERLKDTRAQLSDCAGMEGRGLGAFVARDRERAELELELIAECVKATQFASKIASVT